ncbi:hypothetical protein EHQ58_03110 [Leptospira ognonensis]|uniref:Uncharacterized protein n=1 Tax=Leptospira ognonensis TaxID=2484945 RepID=A0A4R9K7C5_9LEPT|nr:GldG family protein [Leptospira ognonensis]TGL62208.1 hypothetical protein EHQ58_03110 [Leptospira ognonensis]
MKFSQTKIFIFQIIIFFLFSNLAMHELSCRKDISSSERLTLSIPTIERLKNLKKPILIEAYYSSDLPIEYQVRLELVREFLIEIEKQNEELISVIFYAPNVSPEIRKRAIDARIYPNEIQRASETSKSFQEAFMGIVLKYDSEIEVIPDFFFVEEAEAQLVRSLRRIQQKQKNQTIAIATDTGIFGTPLPGNGSGINTWGVFYHQAFLEEYGNPIQVALNEEAVPNQIKVLLIVGSPEWNDYAKQRLNDYVLRGGRIIFLVNSMQFRVSPIRNQEGLHFEGEKFAFPSSGYAFWNDQLKSFGFEVGTNLLFDFEHPVSLSKGDNFQKHEYPFWHYFFKSEGNLHQNHELTNNVNLLILPWISTIKIDRSIQTDFTYEIILSTNKQVWKKENVFPMNIGQNFSDSEIERNRIPVGVLAEGVYRSTRDGKQSQLPTKIFLLSTSYFVSDVLSLPEFRSTFRDANVGFILNIVDFMLDDKEFIVSREKKLAVIPLKSFTVNERNAYSFFNTLFLPLLLVIFSVRRIQLRYSRRNS